MSALTRRQVLGLTSGLTLPTTRSKGYTGSSTAIAPSPFLQRSKLRTL